MYLGAATGFSFAVEHKLLEGPGGDGAPILESRRAKMAQKNRKKVIHFIF
jgi:hypothetical protein